MQDNGLDFAMVKGNDFTSDKHQVRIAESTQKIDKMFHSTTITPKQVRFDDVSRGPVSEREEIPLESNRISKFVLEAQKMS